MLDRPVGVPFPSHTSPCSAMFCMQAPPCRTTCASCTASSTCWTRRSLLVRAAAASFVGACPWQCRSYTVFLLWAFSKCGASSCSCRTCRRGGVSGAVWRRAGGHDPRPSARPAGETAGALGCKQGWQQPVLPVFCVCRAWPLSECTACKQASKLVQDGAGCSASAVCWHQHVSL